jgi:hypothetical protein
MQMCKLPLFRKACNPLITTIVTQNSTGFSLAAHSVSAGAPGRMKSPHMMTLLQKASSYDIVLTPCFVPSSNYPSIVAWRT